MTYRVGDESKYGDVSQEDVDRFWSKTATVPYCGCIVWTAAVDKDGYGKFQTTNRSGVGPKQFHHRAHRFALSLKLGREPLGLVLHSCDVPACVNPAHLSEGTQRQNIADMDRRGRRRAPPPPIRTRDSGHHAAKLSTAQIRELRRRRLGGERVMDLAAEAGLNRTTMGALLGPTRHLVSRG